MELTNLRFDVCWMQTLNGFTEVLERDVPAQDALRALHWHSNLVADAAGAVVFLRPSNDVLAAVAAELERARAQHAPIRSAHEGYAVLLEELDEVWTEVKRRRDERSLSALRRELIQVAAMAVRMVEDLEL